MEKHPLLPKQLTAAGLALAGALTLSACSEAPPDYEGVGHEFTVTGMVSDSEADGLVQLKEEGFTVVSGVGKAATWFADGGGHTMLSGEIDFLQRYSGEPDSFWSGCGTDVYVGKVQSATGGEIAPEDLNPGDLVEIGGRIRDSNYWQTSGKSGYCAQQELAVYDWVRVVPPPQE